MSLINEARLDFAERIVKSKDKIISEAISRCIGDNWSLDEIKGRCRTLSVDGDTFEVFYIDDRPIIEFDEPSFDMKDNHMTSELPYRFIGKDCRV